MWTNQQIKKIRSRTVEKLFGSHHKIFTLTIKTHKQFLRKRGIKCRPINKSETRSTVNIWIPSRDQNCRVFVCTRYNISYFKWLFTPQPLRAVRVLLSPMVSGWAGGRAVGRAAGNNLSGLYLRNRKV